MFVIVLLKRTSVDARRNTIAQQQSPGRWSKEGSVIIISDFYIFFFFLAYSLPKGWRTPKLLTMYCTYFLCFDYLPIYFVVKMLKMFVIRNLVIMSLYVAVVGTILSLWTFSSPTNPFIMECLRLLTSIKAL